MHSLAGHIQVMWSNYVDTMREAGFNGGQGLYIASGLLTYGAKEGNYTISAHQLGLNGSHKITSCVSGDVDVLVCFRY